MSLNNQVLVDNKSHLTVFVFCFIFTLSAAESFTGYGERSFLIGNLSLVFQDNESNPATSAREYLGKFGWVEPFDWAANSPRINETEIDRLPSLVDEGEQSVTSRANNTFNGFGKNTELSEEEFEKVLIEFQIANNLTASGFLDEETMLFMTQPRCGVPDQTALPNNTLLAVLNATENEEFNEEELLNSFDEILPSTIQENEVDSSATIVRLLRRRRFADGVNFIDGNIDSLSPRLSIKSTDGTNAKDPGDAEVSLIEGKLPEESRVESLEGILAALLREKITSVSEEQMLEMRGYASNVSNLLQRIVSSARETQIDTRRQKRSSVYQRFNPRNGWGLAFAKKVITWRLVLEWPSTNTDLLSYNEVWFTLKLAFRMWSEILPRTFMEDKTSPVNEVDILIGFGTGLHNRCPVRFTEGPFMREYAHAWPLPKAEIHFNDAQQFVPISWIALNYEDPSRPSPLSQPISLLKVAIHEIGHTLGLPHNEQRFSVMNPIYQAQHSKMLVELSSSDRQSIRNIYGSCNLQFDVVFDWVRQDRSPDGQTYWKYNTYFFRKTWYWLYENRAQRPRYGDPKLTADYWRGVMEYPNDPHNKLDGAVHIRSWQSINGPTFFFKGDIYVEYDSMRDQTKRFDRFGRSYPRRIEDDFKGVPFPINTVYYNFKEGILYFFKDARVYRYNWTKGRLMDSAFISQAFPGWGGATALPGNIDAAYYSYAYQATYFFKGQYFWKLADNRDRESNKNIVIPYYSVGPRRKISSKWLYICDVGESELRMNLPTS